MPDDTNGSGRGTGFAPVVYLLLFGAFLVGVALLELTGVPNLSIAWIMLLAPFLLYVAMGVALRTSDPVEYLVAGRRITAFPNGMAIAGDWLSAASFVGLAGSLFLQGFDGSAWLLGWTGGFLLAAALIVPYLRKSGVYTVPDFLGARFDSTGVRLTAVLAVVACTFSFLVAQIFGTALIASRSLGIDFGSVIVVVFIGILLCSVLGGMRAITWTQVAQYVILLIAFLLPVVFYSLKKFGAPIPHLALGEALSGIASREQELLRDGLATAATLKPHLEPFVTFTPANYVGILICMMAGSAVMPHVLSRYLTTPSVRDAHRSVFWALFFIALVYLTVPMYAVFAKLEIYTGVIGRSIAELPRWVYTFGELGLVNICGRAAQSVDQVLTACKNVAGHPGVLRWQDVAFNTDVIAAALPEMVGAPYFIFALATAGAMAAALSTADGLLIACANAISHDVFYKTMAPGAPAATRLRLARIAIVLTACLAAWVASLRSVDVLAMVGWSFSLAASALLPVLVLSIWWRRINAAGALAGMLAGAGICVLYYVVTRYFPGYGVAFLGMDALVSPSGWPIVDLAKAMAASNAMDAWVPFTHPLAGRVGWLGLSNIAAGVFGVPAGLLAAWLVSLATRAPGPEADRLVTELRRPYGTPNVLD